MSAERASTPPDGYGPFGLGQAGLEHARDFLLVVLAALAAWEAVASFQGYVFEDSYITYRYAENLAQGRGFVFNPGERVLGTSTPLWTLVLAGGARLTGLAIPELAGYLFAAAWAGFALLGAALLRSRGRGNAGALFALATLAGAGGILLVWGMETALDLLLLFGALAAARARRGALLGVLLGSVMITRFDTVLFAGLLLLLLLLPSGRAGAGGSSGRSRRRVVLRAFLVATSIVLPWLIFSQLYFGAPFPHTLSAKAGDEGAWAYLRGALRLMGMGFFTPLLRLGAVPFAAYLPLLWLLLLAPLPFLARRAAKGEPVLLILALFPLGLWLAYGLIGPPVEHTWHMLPAMFLLFALALLCLSELAPALESSRPATLLTCGLILLGIAVVPRSAERERAVVEESSEYGRRVRLKDEFAGVIETLGLSGSSLCIAEVGYMGYRSGCRMIDATGLITPGIRGHGPENEQTSLAQVAEEFQPDLFALPTRSWPNLSGYRALHTSVHLKTLYARSDLLLERADALAGRAAPAALPGNEGPRAAVPGHEEDWWSTHDRRPFIGSEGELYTSGRAFVALTSGPFEVDFDELSFDLFAHDCAGLSAQLLIDGQVVWRARGAGEDRPRRVRWPMARFRGCTAHLQLLDSDPDRDLSFSGLERADWDRVRRLGGGSVGWAQWSGDFERTAPEDHLALLGASALRRGPLASRLGPEGTGRFASAPFEVQSGQLLAGIFSIGEAALTLTVDGDEVLRKPIAPSSEWQAVHIELGPWEGRSAVLAVEDLDPGVAGPLIDGVYLP